MVPKRSIKKVGGSSKGRSRDGVDTGTNYNVGDKVEARCKGSKKHYPGKVAKVNRDGTYYIMFDDGDRDLEVPERAIKSTARESLRQQDRSSDDDSPDDGGAKYRVGDKVEARCKGSKKHYPGKVAKVNRDGTYYVKFDDGDRDLEVPERAIKVHHKTKRTQSSRRQTTMSDDE